MTVNFRFSISVLFVEMCVENLENRPFKIDMEQAVCTMRMLSQLALGLAKNECVINNIEQN